MGGCCCSSSGRAESSKCAQSLDENEPLSATCGTSSTVSVRMFFNRSIDTSSPDTYRAPSAPLPYDTDLTTCSQTLPRNYGECTDNTDRTQQTDAQPVGEILLGCRHKRMDLQRWMHALVQEWTRRIFAPFVSKTRVYMLYIKRSHGCNFFNRASSRLIMDSWVEFIPKDLLCYLIMA